MGAMPKTKKAASKKRAASRSKKAGAKKVTGTVLKIVNGKPTDERLSAERAFSDLEQARAQVLYCEQHGSSTIHAPCSQVAPWNYVRRVQPSSNDTYLKN